MRGYDLLKDRLHRANPLAETVIVTSKTKTVDDPGFQAVVTKTTAGIRTLTALVNTAPTKTFNYYEAKQAPAPAAAGD